MERGIGIDYKRYSPLCKAIQFKQRKAPVYCPHFQDPNRVRVYSLAPNRDLPPLDGTKEWNQEQKFKDGNYVEVRRLKWERMTAIWPKLLEQYCSQQKGVELEVVRILEFYDHYITQEYGDLYSRTAKWIHMNFFAKLKDDDDPEKLYFAEVVQIYCSYNHNHLYRVLDCLPVPVEHHHYDSDAAGNCEICTDFVCSVFHPSREFYTGAISSMDPSHIPEWIEAGKLLDREIERRLMGNHSTTDDA